MKAFCGQSVESAYVDVMIHTRMHKQSKSRDVVYKLIMSDKTKAIQLSWHPSLRLSQIPRPKFC